MKRQIFIFGYYGWKNVGDDMMLYGLLQKFGNKNPGVTFAILSQNPVIVPTKVKNRIVFVTPSIFRVLKEILRSYAFVIGGGTHLFEYGNKIKIFKIQLRLFLIVLYAKILRKKVYIVGNSLGPFQSGLGELLPKVICNIADYISVRDKASYKLLVNWGFAEKASLSFDLSVLSGFLWSRKRSLAESKRVLGISITPVFKIYYRDKKDLKVVNEISKCINEWLKDEVKAEVWLFTFHGPSYDDDVFITKLLQDKLKTKERVKYIGYDPNPKKMITQMGQCNAFIGMKLHSCIFAYINSLPLLVIEYHPKCRAFAEEIGLPKNAIVTLEEILNGQFENYFKRFQEHPENFLPTLPLEMARKRAEKGLPNI